MAPLFIARGLRRPYRLRSATHRALSNSNDNPRSNPNTYGRARTIQYQVHDPLRSDKHMERTPPIMMHVYQFYLYIYSFII